MTEQEIIKILEDSGALLTGHFQLRSGLHSSRFFQAALLLQYPDKAETVCRFLADQFRGQGIETVISPAVGGLIVGQEVARALGVRAIFADKEDGRLEDILKEHLELDKVTLIPCGQGSEIDAAREQWSDGSNTLAIGPGEVVVYSRNYVTNRALEEAGIRLHTIPSAELSRGRGGPRCMSMPLWREDP